MSLIDKRVKDLMDFTFPQEQQIPLAPQNEIPQAEGLVPQVQQPIESYDAMLEADKMDKQATPEVSPVVEDPRIAQLSAQVKALQSSRARVPTSRPATQPDFRDKFADELKKTREQNKSDLDQARESDRQTQLLNQLMKASSQIGEGIANKAGYTKIKMEPAQFAAEAANAMASDNKEKLATLMEQYNLMSDKEKAKIDAENRKLQAEDRAFDRNIKLEQLGLERAKLLKSSKEQAGEGQKQLDRAAAKEYQDWTSGGQKTAQSEIGKLKGIADKLRSGTVNTGMFSGLLPDRFTSNELLGARADVESTVMNSLKAILGPQFTENEGKRMIANTWNEGDSTENNLARLDRLVNDLENKANDKTQKANYFENSGGTLKGFKANSGQPASTNQVQPNEVERKTADGKTAIFDATTKQFLRYK